MADKAEDKKIRALEKISKERCPGAVKDGKCFYYCSFENNYLDKNKTRLSSIVLGAYCFKGYSSCITYKNSQKDEKSIS